MQLPNEPQPGDQHNANVNPLVEVERAIDNKDWSTALEKLYELLKRDASNEDLMAKFKMVRAEEINRLCNKGRAAFEAERWRDSLSSLRQVAIMQEGYENVDELIASARSRISKELHLHFKTVANQILNGEVIPFLGAGVNSCGRPDKQCYKPGRYVPSAAELTNYLVNEFPYPEEEVKDLLSVSQYIGMTVGSAPLYNSLHELFDNDEYEPTELHHFLARLAGILRSLGKPCQLIVTTNYDDMLERAFQKAREPYDLIWYMASKPHKGNWMHWAPGEEKPNIVLTPNKYNGLNLKERTIILKIHGAVDRISKDEEEQYDSFVISEDDYIDYLVETEPNNIFPIPIPRLFNNNHFLFMGYGLRDWNLRVMLNRVWGEDELDRNSWAVQTNTPEYIRDYWNTRKLKILNEHLDDYIAILEQYLQARPTT
ncbi:MAG TPA: SIR2 family protein [Blastocatellia bacterium]|nr:SIR2 family protein [Blastocatellia bacterium]